MSVSVYAYAVIGLKVPWSKIHVGTEKIRSFDHNYPKDWQVDPKTQKPLWKEIPQYIDQYDYDDDDDDRPTLAGYDILSEYDNDEYVFVCLKLIESNDLMYGGPPGYLNIDNLEADIKEFKSELESAGVWDDDEFGLWLVGMCG